MHRRTCLRMMAGTALGLPALHRAADAADRFAKYKGTTIVVNFPAHPHYDAATTLVPEFTRQTGIKVEIDKLQYLRMHDKQLLEMSKPQCDYDLVCMLGMWKTEYVKKDLIAPLEPMLADPGLADPDYDRADLIPAYVEVIGLVGGPKGYLPGPGAALYALPYGAETSILAYRKDVFDRLGLAPPATYDALLAMLAPLRDKSGMGAMTSRGQSGHQAMHAFTLHFRPLGGEFFTDAWAPSFASPAGEAAIDVLKAFVATGPAGIASYGFGEMENAFLLGQSAMYLDTIAVFGDVRNPQKSKVDGKVGYALHPRGSRSSAESGGFGLAIPKRAAHKEAAFLFMQWLTSKAQDVAVVKAGGVAQRSSTLSDPALLNLYPEFAILKEQLRATDPDWRPVIPEWTQIDEQILGVQISEALIGRKTPREALDAAVGPVDALMRRGGYRKA
jgi:multiple sugar transport system substrate-binding protein